MDFPDCLEGKYGLCPTQCHTSAQCAETLERTIATYVDKNPVAMKNSASDSDGDVERYEIVCLHFSGRPTVTRK